LDCGGSHSGRADDDPRCRLPKTPINGLVWLQKIEPDLNKISAWIRRYFYAVATQGAMQAAIIVIMTRLRAGI
jgi:hypothetical protein